MRIGLKTYLSLVLLATSGLPILAFLLWPFTSIYDEKLAEVRERHLLIAKHQVAALELYHHDIVIAMEAFAPRIAAGDADAAFPVFKHLNFYHVCIADIRTGKVVGTYLAEANPCPASVDLDLISSFLERDADTQVVFDGVVVPSGLTPRIRVAFQVDDQLVIGAIGTQYFIELQRQVTFGENGHAVVVDQFGAVLAHPSEEWERDARSIAGIGIVQSMMRGELGVQTFYSPVFKEDMIAGFASVPDVGWAVMVPQPLSELEVSAETFNREVVFILLTGLAAALLIAFSLGRSFNRRLSTIQSNIDAIADGADELDIVSRRKMVDVRNFVDLEQGIARMFADLKTAQITQQEYSDKLEENNTQLQQEVNTRKMAESLRDRVEQRYRNLFEHVPMPIREEDLSGLKERLDAHDFPDEDALCAFLDAHPEFLEECGRAVRIVDANAASVELHGYADKSEMKARVLEKFGPESLNFIRAALLEIYRGNTRSERETVIYQGDGKRRHLISTWSILPGHEHDYSRSLLSSVDITAKVEAEEALQQSQKMEAIGQLTGGIAHDFNNLLMVIQSNAELLEGNDSDEKELIAPIISSAQRGAELTKRLLAFSRKQPLKPAALDLLTLTNSMGDLLRRTLGPNYAIVITGEPDLFPVFADSGQLEGALLNLSINARDAMPSGGTVDIHCRRAKPDELSDIDADRSDYAVLEVRDNGHGMNEDVSARVFEPFFTTKPVGKGSGLGLSMVYGFCRQSGGDAIVESDVGEGTTIKLVLPAAPESAVVEQQSDHQSVQAMSLQLNILLLDDDEVVLMITRRVLETLGHNVSAALTVQEAWDAIQKGTKFDILISDVLLSGAQNGPDFAKDLREDYPDLPIIFLSGYTADHETASNYQFDRSVWMTKPCKRSDIAAAIQGLVHNEQS